MTLSDDLEAELARMEERFDVGVGVGVGVLLGCPAEYEIDPETLEVVDEPTSDHSDAVIADAVRRRTASGVTVFTEEDVAAFEDRLAAALDALAAGGGPNLDAEDVITYIGSRRRGKLQPGQPGVTEHFGADVSKDDIDRAWEYMMEAEA